MMWNHGCDMMWLGMAAGVLAFWVIVVLAVRALFPGQRPYPDRRADASRRRTGPR